MHKLGEVVLAGLPFTDSFEIKLRPGVVLFEEYGNIVVAGMTSNLDMKGVTVPKQKGIIKDSIVKLNYIFSISNKLLKKTLTRLNDDKRKEIVSELMKRINQ